MPEAGGARTAASGQGAAEGLPALASPPRPRSLRALGKDGKRKAAVLPCFPRCQPGERRDFPARPHSCPQPLLPSKHGSGLSSGNSMAGTGTRRAAALPPLICRAPGSPPPRPAGPARPPVGGSGGRASAYGRSLSAER